MLYNLFLSLYFESRFLMSLNLSNTCCHGCHVCDVIAFCTRYVRKGLGSLKTIIFPNGNFDQIRNILLIKTWAIETDQHKYFVSMKFQVAFTVKQWRK